MKDAEGVNFPKDVWLTKFVSFLLSRSFSLVPVKVDVKGMDKW